MLGPVHAPRTAGQAVRHRLFVEDHGVLRGRLPWIQLGARPHAVDRERCECGQPAPDLRGRVGRRRFAVHRHRSIGARHPPQREHAVPDRKQRCVRPDQGAVLGVGRRRHQGETRRREFLAADRPGAVGADLGRNLRGAQLLGRQGAACSADSSGAAPQRVRLDRRAFALRHPSTITRARPRATPIRASTIMRPWRRISCPGPGRSPWTMPRASRFR